MSRRPLSSLAGAFEGVFPTTLATSSRDGDVNLIFVSQVHLVDDDHVAFSEQFLRRTLDNLLTQRRAQATLVDPTTGKQYRLDLEFARRETEGPVVERMRVALEAVAAGSSMATVFRLRAAIVCRVLAVRDVVVTATSAGGALPALPVVARPALRAAAFGDLVDALEGAANPALVCAIAVDHLASAFGLPDSVFMLSDPGEVSLSSAQQRGMGACSQWSRVRIPGGPIGQCAAHRRVVKLSSLSRATIYARAVDRAPAEGAPPWPPGAESVVAVPVLKGGTLFGVLAVVSPNPAAFDDNDVETLSLVARLAAGALALCRPLVEAPSDRAVGDPVRVRYYEGDDSVFVDDVYIAKGVAGRALWAMVEGVVAHGRRDFTNRELRLDPRLALPALNDNLEARLLLLRRRLEARSPRLLVEPAGRGRLRVRCDAAIVTETLPSKR